MGKTFRLLLAALMMIALYFWLSFIYSAPAPRHLLNQVTESNIEGNWVMDWSGTKCDTTFYRGGKYTHLYNGKLYQGNWWVKKGVLIVQETDDPAGVDDWKLWKVRLNKEKMTGVTTGGDYPNFSVELVRKFN